MPNLPSNTVFIDSFNANTTAPVQPISVLPTNVAVYLATNELAVPNTVSSNTVVFNRGFLAAPSGSGLPNTSVKNFSFYVNGQFVSPSSIISFSDNGNSTSTLLVDTGSLKYNLKASLEIIAMGKFI